jgi:hypothetical protein
MNNSLITIENILLEVQEDEKPDLKPSLRQKESETLAIIKAIEGLSSNKDWLLLKEKIFDGVLESLKKQREVEVEKKPLNGPVIHSLNGQLAWAKKYSNISNLASIYKQELDNIRRKLNAND